MIKDKGLKFDVAYTSVLKRCADASRRRGCAPRRLAAEAVHILW